MAPLPVDGLVRCPHVLSAIGCLGLGSPKTVTYLFAPTVTEVFEAVAALEGDSQGRQSGATGVVLCG